MRAVAGALGCLVTLATLFTVSLPAEAQTARLSTSTCPVLDLENPEPGDVISGGDYVVSGVAFDPVTMRGSDVSRVDLYLGARDAGGILLASAKPGDAESADPRAFQATLKFPDVDRTDELVGYAFSATSDATTSVAVPIHVGSLSRSEPQPAAESVTVKTGCPVVVQGPAPQSTTTVPVVAITQHQGPVLLLDNPDANAVLSHGTLAVSGFAFDPASTDGPGVDRVEFFLDSRDTGGVSLGEAVPGAAASVHPRLYSTTVTIPSNASGGRDFVAYARSTVTGLETVVSVPVFIGAAP